MNRIVVFVFFNLIFGFVVHAQNLNQKVWDPDLEEYVLTGECSREGLEQGNFGNYFNEEYKAYTSDQEIVKEIREKLNTLSNYNVVVIFGEWCSDSQMLVPEFFKIADEVGIQEDKIKIYAVNRKKEGGDVDLSKYNVDYVPIFIIYENGKEKGRIVESPEETMEKDLLKILTF